ncbi:MAG TPA: T9SS type A sorting domain-containing protein [Bacteroidia bacterium]
MMIKKLLSVTLVAAALVSNAQQLTNNGFETWASSIPSSWGTMDGALAADGLSGGTSVTKSSTPHSGSFAVTLTTKGIPIVGTVAPGIIEYGSMSVNIGTQAATFKGLPYTSSPSSATYWIFGTVASGDSSGMQIILTKWNTVTNKRDTIGLGYDRVPTSGITSSYTMRTVNITYTTSPPAPDTIQCLVISSILKTPVVGNTITVDDINLVFTTGIEPVHASQAAILAYPNPAVNQITLSSPNEKAKYAKVYDLTGRLISTHELINKTAILDINAFENGMYLYNITDENNHSLNTSKFSVSK